MSKINLVSCLVSNKGDDDPPVDPDLLEKTIEQAEAELPPTETACIMDVLDALMFGDNPHFALDRSDLQRLITQLQSL